MRGDYVSLGADWVDWTGAEMSSLSIFCPSTGGHEEAVTTWQDTMSKPWEIVIDDRTTGNEAGFLTKCDKAWRETDATIIGYIHSDLTIHETGWDERVRSEFDNPGVSVVGFVGATGLAHEDIYKVPYDFRQLARTDVWSNLTDAEAHGRRDPGSRTVAVLDSCAVFVRRSLLVRSNGWPVADYPNSSHCTDLWICCMARRFNLIVRMVGVSCTHRSGGKGAAGTSWLDQRGGDSSIHKQAHTVTYEMFRDVLPIRVVK